MEIEPSEDSIDVLEVVEDSWEALDTKIARSKAGKLRRILQLFRKTSSESSLSPSNSGLHGHLEAFHELLEAPEVVQEPLETRGGRSEAKSIEKSLDRRPETSSNLKKTLQLLGKS